MKKVKTIMLRVLYLMLVVVSIPFILLLGVANLVLYGICKFESLVIEDLENDDLTAEWNKAVESFMEMIDSIKDLLRIELEL